MARLFVAIDFDLDIDSVKNIGEVKGVRLLDHFHLTLSFLGDVDEENIDSIKKAIDSIDHGSFNVSTTHLGAFPDENYARVVWVGLKPEAKMIELQKKVDDALSELGFKKNDSFKPHITIARVKFVDDKKDFKEKLKLKVKEQSFDIAYIKLKKSTLTKEGPIYEDLLNKKLLKIKDF